MSLLCEGDHNVYVGTAASSGAMANGFSTNQFVERGRENRTMWCWRVAFVSDDVLLLVAGQKPKVIFFTRTYLIC
jgi:hypothetical protein